MNMRRLGGMGALVWLLLVPVAAQERTPAPGFEAATSRGALLYENHCQSCHTSVLHVREDRRARSAAEVTAWVRRWAAYSKLDWSEEEMKDVTGLLVQRYYRFPEPTPGTPKR